jgi:hypothetical protein
MGLAALFFSFYFELLFLDFFFLKKKSTQTVEGIETSNIYVTTFDSLGTILKK